MGLIGWEIEEGRREVTREERGRKSIGNVCVCQVLRFGDNIHEFYITCSLYHLGEGLKRILFYE